MQSKAATVVEYVASLPEDRKVAVEAVRKVILKNLGKGYAEGMTYGMIGYFVPHSVYPAGYHCDPKQPLPFAGLASQKNHLSLYMMGLYIGGDGSAETELAKWFREAWAKTGKKLDMGKACIRFKKLEDLSLEVIGEAVKRVPVEAYIERYEAALATPRGAAGGASGKKAKPSTAAAKPAAKKTVKTAAGKASSTPAKSAAKVSAAGKKPSAAGKRAKKV